jgi:anthranilate phosphoribosyltransferase
LLPLTFEHSHTAFTCSSWHQKSSRADALTLFCCKGIKRCVNEVGVGFMISANYHPAMKIVRPVRKQLKIKTVFNILGPLLNPARVPYAVIGVYHEDIVSFI